MRKLSIVYYVPLKMIVFNHFIKHKKGLLNVVIDDCNYKVCLLIFDGLQIPLNSETKKYSTPEKFKILSSIIENETGFNLEIVKKPFDDRLDLSLEIVGEEDNDDVFILDDGDAAERIISKFAECMIKIKIMLDM